VFSRFFIDRPIFASVLSLLIVFAGLVAMKSLPIAQFPEVVPPVVAISAAYPGADAKTVSDAVASPIEQQLSGAKNLLYFQSSCGNDGSLNIAVTFEVGTDLDLAQVDVQNRINQASARLPDEVRRQGVTVLKKSNNMVQVVVLDSSNPQHDQLFLSNYATIYLLDAIKRVPGIGAASIFGAGDYAMRLWLDPDKLAARGLTVTDVKNAILEKNGLYAAGRIGQRPTGGQVELTIPVTTRGRLDTPEEFGSIILHANADGSMLRVHDVARVELGSVTYDLYGRCGTAGVDTASKPSTLLLTYLQAGANAIDTARQTTAALEAESKRFPAGMRYVIASDNTKFITVSIEEVVKALRDAIILVLIVVFLFLQNWRSALIPLLAVPVSIIGTFAGLLVLGFSINTLTLFSLVLAIGIVVDDAIVVVENVERIMAATGKSVRDSTIQAMEEVSGPVVAIVLVLCSVFIPVAFLGGLTGRFYQQFALTIAVSVVISGIVALTLSPALCRLLLKPHNPERHARGPLAWFFGLFNRSFDTFTRRYTGTVSFLLRRSFVGLLVFGALGLATYGLFLRVPSGFIPGEDQGYFMAQIVLPEGSSLDRTDAMAKRVEAYMLKQPGVDRVITLGGLNMLANGTLNSNATAIVVALKDWSERKAPAEQLPALIGGLYYAFAKDPDGVVLPFNMPPVPGLGTRIGFEFQLQDRNGLGLEALAAASQELMTKLNARPEITSPSISYSYTQPLLSIDLDRERIAAMGLSLADVFATLQTQLGSLYVNDFTQFGRVWRVQLQAEPAFRASPDAIGRMYVRNAKGELLPLASVVQTKWKAGPNMVTRFQGFPAVAFTGSNSTAFSSGQAMDVIEEVAKTLPDGFGIEWSGASLQERRAGSQAPIVLACGLLIVFLVLSAQYESFRLPVIVLLAVPLGIFGAMAACWITGLPNNIYVQIGLLVLVGLAAKNAILIVEFAVEQLREGKSVADAAAEAARLRFRPILMTSLAFILGVVPLIVGRGAGAAGRVSMGVGVFGGMVAATVFAVLLVPVFFRLLAKAPKKDAAK
jgi:hydrophobe/amphiphile efflux-1 (HAE1) family protein